MFKKCQRYLGRVVRNKKAHNKWAFSTQNITAIATLYAT